MAPIPRHHLWINGKDHPSSDGQTSLIEHPFDHTEVAEVDIGTPQDVAYAVEAAAAARQPMRELATYERAAILRRAGQLLEQNAEELVKTVVHEVGKPIRDAHHEVGRAAEVFAMAADYTRSAHEGEVLPMDVVASGVNRFGFSIRVPVGIVAAIAPFNSPINLSSNKVAPALAAGNTIVLKPAPQTPVSVLTLAKILHEAGVPAGALNVVNGGADVGSALVSDPRVRMVTFTGSDAVGLAISQNAGIKQLALELGSSSANIVCADADVKVAAERLATSAFMSSGQACISAQRLIVHESVVDEFLETFIARAEAMKIGDPFDESTEIGPMISTDAVERVLKWIDQARDAGTKVLTGGERVGNTLKPTLLSELLDDTPLAHEEAFAPVATLKTFASNDEAIRIANDSIYGLQAGVFTNDLTTALKFAQEVEVGGIWINDSSRYRQDNYPFGGAKHSGLGREGIRYAIEEMTETRFVGIRAGVTQGLL